MMKLILKPTPVSVTTPITMPTVAAAAPTASAYLAPVSNASTSTPWRMRPVMPASFQPASAIATPTANRPSLIHSLCWPEVGEAITRQQRVQHDHQRPVLRRCCRWSRVVRPTMAQEVMPVNAAR